MDNMAYLQTIANPAPEPKAGKTGPDLSFLKKIFNLKTGIAAAIVLVVGLVTMFIVNSLNQVDNRDRDYLIQSTFAATHLDKIIVEKYTKDVHSSDLRTMGSTLSGTLKSIVARNTDTLLSVYGVKLNDYAKSFGAIEETRINGIRNTFEEARLNGILDRVYVRELTLQIMIINTYESEVEARTKNDAVRNFVQSDMLNLSNVHKQFSDFSDASA